MSVPTLQQIYNDLQNPMVDLGAAAMGLGACIREISAFLLKIITALKSPTGQKEIKDVATLAADFQQAAADAGHPAPAQVNQAVNTILAALPVTQIPPPQPTVPKVPLLLLAFLLAGLGVSRAHAVSLSLGPISISPTAGPCVVTVIPAVEMSFYRMGAGAIFTNENDGVVGIQALLNWGQYNLGIEGAFDKDISDNVNYGAAGVVVGLQPYGQIAALWRDKGAILGYSVPLTSIGISAQ